MAAASVSLPPSRESARTPEDILGLTEPIGEEYENLFRPSLADRLQIGFLRTDKNTQTVDTEIVEIKQLTETVKKLVEEMGELKQNLEFSKQVITAKYNSDLQNTAHDLHTKLQERLNDMEEIHEERVSVIRRSFKQQLQDALVQMAAKYKRYYEGKLAGKITPTTTPSAGKKRISTLEAEIQRNQSIIQMMEVQMEELRAELAAKPDMPEFTIDTTELDEAQAQNDALQAEIAMLTNRVDELSDAVDFRESRIRAMTQEMVEQKEATEKEQAMTRKLAKKIEEMKDETEQERENWQQNVNKIRNSMQDSMADEMKRQMEAQQAMMKEQERTSSAMEMEKQRLVEEVRKKFEKLLAKERETIAKLQKEAEESKSVETVLQQQKSEVSVLKTRLGKTQKQWEKKFAVLRASMHALKDESYIRQQLQKQSATLKYASISYGHDAPPQAPHQSVVPPPATSQPADLNPNRPLPAIRSAERKRLATNTLPSGPGTEVFTVGAVDSGDEQEMDEYVEGFVPLPSPPQWQRHQFGEYMPTVDQPTNY